MRSDELVDFLYEYMDRAQLRNVIKSLTGARERHSRPLAAERLRDLFLTMGPSERARAFELVLDEGVDWKAACEQFELRPKKDLLGAFLLGPEDAKRRADGRRRRDVSAGRTDGAVQLVFGDAYIETLCAMVQEAVQHLVLVTYVVDRGVPVYKSLSAAADRGVAIELVLDERPPVSRKNRLFAGEVEKSCGESVRIRWGRVHAKALVVDRTRLLLGSSNVDHGKDIFQANVVLQDARIAAAFLEQMDCEVAA